MKILEQRYQIKAPISEVWKALTDPKTIEKWGGGPAKMSEKEGAEFKFWGGDIHGKNTKVVPQRQLDQDWMSGNWDEFSKLSFKLSFKNGVTTVDLTQTGIPDEEFYDIADGWKRYYLGEIKKLLES